VILAVGIIVLVAMLGLAVGLAVCAAIVARRSDEAFEPEYGNALEPPRLADEPAVVTRRFARDPDGRPIAAPRGEPPRPSVASH
jgi:hypothetical protein